MKIILGAGAAGLISGWYLRKNGHDVLVIADKIGGWQNLQKKSYSFGPRLIKIDENTKELLSYFGLKQYKKNIKIAYEYENKNILTHIDNNFKQKYSQRTREIENTSSHLSNSQNNFDVFDINYDTVLKKCEEYLLFHNSIKIGKIKSINNNLISLQDEEFEIDFDKTHIINTIPLNIFQKLANINLDCNFKCFNTNFVYCKILDNDLKNYFINNKIDYLYSIYDENFHRINFINQDYFLCENKGFVKIENMHSNRFELIESTIVPSAQIQQSINLSQVYIGNKIIWLVGRYAQWRHGIVINDIINTIKNIENKL